MSPQALARLLSLPEADGCIEALNSAAVALRQRDVTRAQAEAHRAIDLAEALPDDVAQLALQLIEAFCVLGIEVENEVLRTQP